MNIKIFQAGSPPCTVRQNIKMQLLNTIINKALALDPDLPLKLSQLQGKNLAIHLTDLNFTFYVQNTPDGVKLTTRAQVATATISGASYAILKMGLSTSIDTLALMQKNQVTITGDIEFGMEMKRILDSANIDWEEYLSLCTGDIIAHQVSQTYSEGKQWMQSLHQLMQSNIQEYLQEEARFFPTRAEFEDWLADLDELRIASDRMHARFERLIQKAST